MPPQQAKNRDKGLVQAKNVPVRLGKDAIDIEFSQKLDLDPPFVQFSLKLIVS